LCSLPIFPFLFLSPSKNMLSFLLSARDPLYTLFTTPTYHFAGLHSFSLMEGHFIWFSRDGLRWLLFILSHTPASLYVEIASCRQKFVFLSAQLWVPVFLSSPWLPSARRCELAFLTPHLPLSCVYDQGPTPPPFRSMSPPLCRCDLPSCQLVIKEALWVFLPTCCFRRLPLRRRFSMFAALLSCFAG